MAIYYVDATLGKDTYNGTTTTINDGASQGPWKTIAKVNAASFSAGDSVLFNKGNIWREQLTVPLSGTAGNPVTFNSYGTGADPIIAGSKLASVNGDWTNDGGSSSYWSNGFESNNFTGGGWSETDAYAYLATAAAPGTGHGSYSAHWVHTESNVAYIKKTLVAAQANATLTFYVYPVSTTTPGDYVYITQDNDPVVRIDWQYSAPNWQIRFQGYNDAGTASSWSNWYTLGAVNAWYQVQVVVTTAATTGSYELKIGGVHQATIINQDNATRGKIKEIQFVGWNSGLEMYIDDVDVSTVTASNLWYTAATATPAVVWKNGARLTYTATKTDLNTDTGVTKWYWDSGNSRVYVYGGGSAPTSSFEIAQRDYCVRGVDKSYITIDGIKCEYANLIGISSAVSAAAATNWTVQNCTVTGCWQGGIWGIGSATHSANYFNANTDTLTDIGGRPTDYWDGSSIQVKYADYFSIHGNTITLSGFTGQHNYTAGIAFFFSKTTGDTGSAIYSNTITGTNTAATLACGMAFSSIYYTDIYLNAISGNYGMGIWTDESGAGTEDGSFNCKYRQNKIVMSGSAVGRGFLLEVSHADRVYYNIIDAAGTADPWAFIMGVGIAADSYQTNTTVYNNTFKTANGGITVQTGNAAYGARKIKNVTFKNNIISGNTTSGALMLTANNDSGTDGLLFDYNSYYDAGTPAYLIRWFGTTYASAALFHAGVSSQETHGITGDQLLTAYIPAPNSPCRNAGVDVGLTTDYAGNAVGIVPDIGAYEYPAVVPTLTTAAISAILKTSAASGGNVSDAGDATVSARGVCYGTSTNPTVAGSKTTDGSGLGAFTSSLTGLSSATTYHVRAYATNSAGTAYGAEADFTTSVSVGGGVSLGMTLGLGLS